MKIFVRTTHSYQSMALFVYYAICCVLLTACTVSSLVLEQGEPSEMTTATSTQAITALDLGQYQWQNRLLLIFAESAATPSVIGQRQRFADERAGFADRELLAFYLYDAGMGEADSRTVDPAATAQLRDKYDLVPGEFAVLLVGKDGGAKNRFTEPVDAEEIYSLIDAMPMRQREMQEE